MEFQITLEQLEKLLIEQKRIVIEKLSGRTGYWNADSTEGNYKTVNINMEKFRQQGMSADYPNDFNVLKSYLK